MEFRCKIDWMAKEFYERFLDCTYILIYQLDAYVFRDDAATIFYAHPGTLCPGA